MFVRVIKYTNTLNIIIYIEDIIKIHEKYFLFEVKKDIILLFKTQI